jgi:hypothetical protein
VQTLGKTLTHVGLTWTLGPKLLSHGATKFPFLSLSNLNTITQSIDILLYFGLIHWLPLFVILFLIEFIAKYILNTLEFEMKHYYGREVI